ncbi:TPA: hypothetical protein ACVGKT_001069 [Pseudomonas aeruginosa]
MTESKICTCPSGDGSLRHPCPAHPASVELAGVAANLTFINGKPAMCGCQVEYSSGGGEYSDVIYVTLCAKHSGSAILDLVATNRIALTPEYEGQWHADLYLDREVPLAKAEGATPAEAVLALMSAERIEPEQGWVEQAGGDERVVDGKPRATKCPDCGEGDLMPGDLCACGYETDPAAGYACSECDGSGEGCVGEVCRECDGSGWFVTPEQARAALAQPSPKCATCNGTGQIVVSGPHYCGELQPPEYETEPCDMCSQPSPAQADEKPGDSILCYGCFAKGVGPDHFDEAGKCLAAQAEQAEAERPEMSSERAAYFMRRFKSEEKLLGPNEQAAVDYVLSLIAQHERIVGDLQRQKHEADTALAWATRHYQTVEQERDAALAKLAELEAKLSDPTAVHQWQFSNAWFDGSEEVVLKAGKEGSPIRTLYAAPVAQAQPEETPGEILAAKLIETWVTKHGKPAPWSTAVEITAVATNMPNDERERLLALDDDVDAQAQHSVPEGWMLVECGIWTQEQVDEMQKTVARFRNSEFVDDRALAMAVADAGQCKAPEISLAELLAAEAQALRDERDSQQRVAIKAMEELAALHARVVVVPERDARRMDTEYPEGWNDCLDELARLNGKTVSEGLLRQLLDSDGIDGIFDAQQNYAAHQELRALLGEQEGPCFTT